MIQTGVNVFLRSTLNYIYCNRVIVQCSVINGLRLDGQTYTGLMKNILLNKSCNILKFMSCEKACSVERKSKHKSKQYRTLALIVIPVSTEAFNFSLREIMSIYVSTVSFFGNYEKYNICTFNHEFQYLNAECFCSCNIIKSFSSF